MYRCFIEKMIFQGTLFRTSTLEHILWRCKKGHRGDILRRMCLCRWPKSLQIFLGCTENEKVMECLLTWQKELHDWGKANRICFDATKESMHILSRSRPAGAGPKILGINFDTKLLMTDAVDKCVSGASWRLYSLLRTRRFHDDAELVCLFKAHILSYIEYRTSAVSHASASVLGPLDALQTRFLKFASYICSRCTDVF